MGAISPDVTQTRDVQGCVSTCGHGIWSLLVVGDGRGILIDKLGCRRVPGCHVSCHAFGAFAILGLRRGSLDLLTVDS